jgi:fucose permease
MLVFFSYCGIEATLGLWGGSWLFRAKGLEPAAAAGWVSAYYAGITFGRLLTGFLTYRFSDTGLIRAGVLGIGAGIALLLAPVPLPCALGGFVLVGLGCAPIFPCMLHATPVRFGAVDAQAIMGFQMAVAYAGLTLLPPAFGWLASRTSLALLPGFLAACLALLVFGTESLGRGAVNRPTPTL